MTVTGQIVGEAQDWRGARIVAAVYRGSSIRGWRRWRFVIASDLEGRIVGGARRTKRGARGAALSTLALHARPRGGRIPPLGNRLKRGAM